MSLEHCIVPEIKKFSPKKVLSLLKRHVVEFKVLALSGKNLEMRWVGKKWIYLERNK